MDKALKRQLLAKIATEQYPETIAELLDFMPTEHPAHSRVSQLARRYRELQERIDLGTLSKDDVARVASRIGGGLRDVVQEYRPLAELTGEASASEESTFKLELAETEAATAPVGDDWKAKGFFGVIDYGGSPTKQGRTLEVHKSYGATYHTAREAIRKAGMEMVKGDRDGGTLTAELAPSGGGGYGEKILLWVTPLAPGKTQVHVVVDSQLPTLAIDFGRNKTKLGILCSYLR